MFCKDNRYIAVIIGAGKCRAPENAWKLGQEKWSEQSQCRGTTELLLECVVWRKGKAACFPTSCKVIHIAASAREKWGGKWGVSVIHVENGGSGSGEMMQSSAWDSFNHTLGFGSVVPGVRQAKRFKPIHSPFHLPPMSFGSTSNIERDPFSTNPRAKAFPPDACLSRSCRLLAGKPPNGTRRGLIPGPLNPLPCAYPLSLAHADISSSNGA